MIYITTACGSGADPFSVDSFIDCFSFQLNLIGWKKKCEYIISDFLSSLLKIYSWIYNLQSSFLSSWQNTFGFRSYQCVRQPPSVWRGVRLWQWLTPPGRELQVSESQSWCWWCRHSRSRSLWCCFHGPAGSDRSPGLQGLDPTAPAGCRWFQH